MHEQRLVLAVDKMLFDFGNVMRDVVDEMHVEVVGRGVEDFGECLTCQERHAAAVHPGVVGCRAHAFQVVLAFGRADARARQLSIVRLDVVSFHGLLHGDQAVRGHLMA